MNRVEFAHGGEWNGLTQGRSRGLITFSNHVSLFDDPLLLANLGTTAYRDLRWIAAEQKNFFSPLLKGFVFSAGKCVPIPRGGGLDQPGFDFLLERLDRNEWVHIFPGGGRTRAHAGRLQAPFKLGIGKLLAQAHPIAIPFCDDGMHGVMPIGSRFPR